MVKKLIININFMFALQSICRKIDKAIALQYCYLNALLFGDLLGDVLAFLSGNILALKDNKKSGNSI